MKRETMMKDEGWKWAGTASCSAWCTNGRFMGRQVFQSMDTHWDHEPGRGALTPTLSHLRFAAEGEGGRDGRFMGSPLFQIDLPTDDEPALCPPGETPGSTAGGTPAATDARWMARWIASRSHFRAPRQGGLSVAGGLRSAGAMCWLGTVLLVGFLGMGVKGATAAPGGATAGDVRRDATVSAVERVLPAVVNIATLTVERADAYEQMLREFFGYARRAPDTVYSSGSGVVIDEEGWVLTNFHVVREASRVQVLLAESTEPLEAQVVSVSEANDLALLQLKAKSGQKFRAVDLAADNDLLLGETVLALGNPYGLGGSVSRGILSSKTRRQERDGETMEVEDWLQTDASINPGNSGGPLVNLRGELIGLNVAVLARAQGIGFAIPVKRIAAALAQMGSPEATRGLWFGATVRGGRPPLVVTEIQRGSPADTAGLEPGDEILAVDGVGLRSQFQFLRLLGSAKSEATLNVQRGDNRREVQVRLLAEKSVFNADFLRRRLGATFERVPDDLARQLRIPALTGLWVASVERGGSAEKAGLARGAIVTAVDGQAAPDLVTVGRGVNRKRAGETMVLDVLWARRRGMVLQLQEGRVSLKLK